MLNLLFVKRANNNNNNIFDFLCQLVFTDLDDIPLCALQDATTVEENSDRFINWEDIFEDLEDTFPSINV